MKETIFRLAIASSLMWMGTFTQTAKAECGWTFKQEFQGFYWGAKDAKVDLTKNAYRLVWQPSRATLQLKAPAWKVTTFNSSHTDQHEFKLFQGVVKGKSVDKFVNAADLKETSKGEIAGVKATEYRASTKYDTSEYHTIVWLADDIEIPETASKLFRMIYGAPDLKRFPLSLEIKKADGTLVKQIKTLSAKKTTFAPGEFRNPPHRSPGKVFQPTLFHEREVKP